MVDRVFKFLTSLRLTVFLLTACVVLVFIGTLAQVDEGLYDAQVRYFKSWLIWRPTMPFLHAQWPILLPGGYLLGTLLLANLLAAHIKRFQLTWKKAGIHLIHGGLIILLLGQLLTDVGARSSAMRIREGEAKNYSEDFRENELALIDMSDPASDRVISIPESLLARKGEIDDPALPVRIRVRNYWPNCEIEGLAPPEAVPALADHGKLTDMLVLPLLLAASKDEARPHAAALVEVLSKEGSLGTYLIEDRAEPDVFGYKDGDWGMTIVFAPAMGGNQLVIFDASGGGGDRTQVLFPEADLTRGKELQNPELPVTIRVKEFWPRCRLYHKQLPRSVVPKITEGMLAGCFVNPEPMVKDSEHRDLPAAVVELIGPEGSLGSRLLWTAEPNADVFSAGGKPYQLVFRFKRYYEPYSIGLLKFSNDIYKGSDTPKNYSARVRLMNPHDHEDREVLIKMNYPLRYKGTTYYQASFDKFDPQVTVLQVVANPSSLVPYISCIMIAAGLITQFLSHLIRFARKPKAA